MQMKHLALLLHIPYCLTFEGMAATTVMLKSPPFPANVKRLHIHVVHESRKGQQHCDGCCKILASGVSLIYCGLIKKPEAGRKIDANTDSTCISV